MYEDVDFATTIRNIMFLGAFIAVLSEIISTVTAIIPPDIPGTTVVVLVFSGIGLLAHRRASRRVLAGCLFFMAALLAVYHARMARFEPESILANQGALFLVVIGSQAVLELSLVEFVVTVGIYVVTLALLLLLTTRVDPASLALMGFYFLATVGMSTFGILGRIRLADARRASLPTKATLSAQHPQRGPRQSCRSRACRIRSRLRRIRGAGSGALFRADMCGGQSC